MPGASCPGGQFVHMARQKKKLSPAQKAAKKKRQKEYMTIFVHGKQKRVKRPVTIDGMDIEEFIRRNVDPIWLHQNELWEYMDLTDDDDPFPSNEFDEKGEKQGLTSANMKMHVGYVSTSEAGDYYQVLFEERDSDSEEDGLEDGKYLLIQRQFELPNGSRIYVESHDQAFIGHFKVVKATLNSKCFCLTLSKKTSAAIEATFETSPENHAEVKRILT